MPKSANRTQTRDFSRPAAGGGRVRTQTDTTRLKGGTTLEVKVVTFAGFALTGVKPAERLAELIAEEKEDGYAVSAPKAVALGDLKGNEYRLTKGKLTRRLVVLDARPRLVTLNVATEGKAKLDEEAADTFLKSFGLVPVEVVEAARMGADNLAATDKANLAKLGFRWTLNGKAMDAPDAPAVGTIRGRDFKPDAVKYANGHLTFRQGKGAVAELEAGVRLVLKPGESVVNRTFDMWPEKRAVSDLPRLELSVLAPKAKLPTTMTFPDKYALKLTFESPAADGTLPGTIYFCVSDETHSYFAGTFKATTK